jgi:hypothetical protein
MTYTYRMLTIAVALTLSVPSSSAQTPAQLHGQKYIGSGYPAAEIDLTTQIDFLDERIALLTADMRMFAGELKIQAMAALIEALIERQQLIGRRMHALDEWMPKGHTTPSPFDVEPETPGDSPEAMCSPFM